mgnify:CR=1 FL=1
MFLRQGLLLPWCPLKPILAHFLWQGSFKTLGALSDYATLLIVWKRDLVLANTSLSLLASFTLVETQHCRTNGRNRRDGECS